MPSDCTWIFVVYGIYLAVENIRSYREYRSFQKVNDTYERIIREQNIKILALEKSLEENKTYFTSTEK